MMNVCFITNELYPFKAGGIGRLMYNFAVQNRQHPTQKHNFYFLVPNSEIYGKELENLIQFFSENDLGTVVATPAEFSYLNVIDKHLFISLQDNYGKEGFIKKSIGYYNGLLHLESKYGIQLDIIEFPDCSAWGFTTINAKKAGLAFQNACISVRLHSTQGVIYHAEPFCHGKGMGQCTIFELERQCIEHADLVVSHLPVITDFNQEIYQFDNHWRNNVVHEFPPIFLDKKELISLKKQAPAQNFVFSSRLQPFKRPDLFIKAAVIFLDRHLNYEGQFYIASYGWDQRYIKWLQDLVPNRHKEKIEFFFEAKAEIRNKLLQSSIIVIPSNYESLCVFAYESVLRGRKLILNRECLAFGNVDYWQENQNCLKFDGSIENLVEVYEQALETNTPIAKPLPKSECYWHLDSLPSIKIEERKKQGKLIIIAYGFTSLAQVNEKLLALSEILINPDFELHLILSHDYQHAFILALPQNVIIHYYSWSEPNPNYIKGLLKTIQTDYLSFLPSHNLVKPEFYLLAKEALDKYDDFSIVTSHTRALKQEDIDSPLWQEANRDDYGGLGYTKLSVGGAESLIGFDLHIVSPCSCVRFEAIDLNSIYEESADFFLPLLMNNVITKRDKVLVIPKTLIVEHPHAKAFLEEATVLASM